MLETYCHGCNSFSFHSNINEQNLRLKMKTKVQFLPFLPFVFCKLIDLYDVAVTGWTLRPEKSIIHSASLRLGQMTAETQRLAEALRFRSVSSGPRALFLWHSQKRH